MLLENKFCTILKDDHSNIDQRLVEAQINAVEFPFIIYPNRPGRENFVYCIIMDNVPANTSNVETDAVLNQLRN